MSRALNAVLVSLREPTNPMAEHEAMCFRLATGLAELPTVFAFSQTLDEGLLEADLLLFGGSGAFSVSNPIHGCMRSWISWSASSIATCRPGGVASASRAWPWPSVAPWSTTTDAPVSGSFEVDLPPAAADIRCSPRCRSAFMPSSVTTTTWLAAARRAPAGHDAGGRLEAFRVEGSHFWAAAVPPRVDRELTLSRLWHYREHYQPDRYEEMVRGIEEGPDEGASAVLLQGIVQLARGSGAGARGPEPNPRRHDEEADRAWMFVRGSTPARGV